MKLNINRMKARAMKVRRLIMSMIVKAHASHIGSSYSIVEILVYLYYCVLKFPSQDRFILSKGWAVTALYSVLNCKGIISNDLISKYCTDGSNMVGVATKNGIPGIEATTGSIGHGLPIAIGMALSMKMRKVNSRVFVILGDGEMDEGSNWESMLIAAHHKLDNLIVIIDYNKWQGFGKTNEVLNLEPLVDKCRAFNWYVEEMDGHDFNSINSTISTCLKVESKPKIIIAHTIKGMGFSVTENNNDYHYKTPNDEEILVAKAEGLI